MVASAKLTEQQHHLVPASKRDLLLQTTLRNQRRRGHISRRGRSADNPGPVTLPTSYTEGKIRDVYSGTAYVLRN